jgi:hypothetical protein
MVGRALLLVLLGGSLVASAGCDDKATAKGPFPKPILARFGKAKLKVGDFKKVDKPETYGASQCHEGPVGVVSVLLCEYPSSAKAEEAGDRRISFVGQAVTGAQRLDGKVALVVADRDKKDLRGLAIQAVLKAFKDEAPY